MPRLRPPREPQATSDGGVIVTPAPDVPEPVAYGSSAVNIAATSSAILVRQPEVSRIPDSAPSDDYEDPRAALREAEERARKRVQELESANAQVLQWGQQQAREAHEARIREVEGNYDTINSALQAAEAEVEAAQQAYAEAWKTGDGLGVAKAQTALNDATYRKNTLQAGKDELETTRRRPPPPPPAPPIATQNVELILQRMPNLSAEERDWIRQHPDSVTDQNNAQLMRAAYLESEKKGIKRGSAEYFALFADRLGYARADAGGNGGRDGGRITESDDMDEPEPPRRVAAPVSRGNGRNSDGLRPGEIFLTQAQREAARASGITEQEYARQLLRLRELKQQGYYQ